MPITAFKCAYFTFLKQEPLFVLFEEKASEQTICTMWPWSIVQIKSLCMSVYVHFVKYLLKIMRIRSYDFTFWCERIIDVRLCLRICNLIDCMFLNYLIMRQVVLNKFTVMVASCVVQCKYNIFTHNVFNYLRLFHNVIYNCSEVDRKRS